MIRNFWFVLFCLSALFVAASAPAEVTVTASSTVTMNTGDVCGQKPVQCIMGGVGCFTPIPCQATLYTASEVDGKISETAANIENTLAQQISTIQNQVNEENLRAMIRQIVQEEMNKNAGQCQR